MTLKPAGNPYTGSPTIAPGVTVIVEPGVHFTLNLLDVEGTLLAEGTAQDPVRFTGAREEGPAEWRSIFFRPGSDASVLDHVEVANGGSRNPGSFGIENGAITVERSAPRIIHSTIRDAGGYGIRMPEGGAPEIAFDTFIDASVARSAIYYNAYTDSTGEVDIHDNLIEGGNAGIDVTINSGSSVEAGTLSGNTVTGTEDALSFSGPDIPGDITENTLVGNKSDLIDVTGTVAHSSTWNDGGTKVKVTGLTVAPGVTLRITPGVHLVNPNIDVEGTLLAEGTAQDPVRFTGARELNAGEWDSIKFEPGSGESVLDHVEVVNGGSRSLNGMILVKGSHPTIIDSTLGASRYYAVKVTESGHPIIEWNRFRESKEGLSYSGTGKLNAPNNDWGCPNGPKPAGCGPSVTSNVEWRPTASFPEEGGHCRGKESQCGEGADPVSLATGALDYSHRDLSLPNKGGAPLEFARAYNSGSTSDTGLGPGWSQTGVASATELQSGEVLIVRQDGRQDLFKATGGGYEAPSGVTDTLAKVEGAFQLTTLEGAIYGFAASGRIVSITDDHGLKTTYGYTAEGRLVTITDPSAQTLTFTYDGTNHITKVKDSTGREVKFGYSAAGDLETATDALGGVTKYGYDGQHRMTSITDPRGNVILENVYDGEGKITEQRDGLENLWKLEYRPSETIVTEPEGGKLRYGFDAQKRVVTETDQLGQVTTTVYDAAGNGHEVIQPGGAKWVFGHDAAGNLTSVEDPEGGVREYEYDAQNRPTSFTDARGNSWSYEWSGTGDLLKTVDPEGGETTLTYNVSGQPLTSTDPNGHKTEFSYDTRGNPLSETDPLGHKTSFEYSTRSYLIAETAPGLKAEKFERDALGDLLSRTTPEGHKTKYAYDKNGLVTQVTDPGENVWTIERNAMERPTAYVDPLEQREEITYNGALKPVKVVDRRGKETTYGYDLANRPTEVDGPEDGDWRYGYDVRGNRSSVVDPRESKTTYSYDRLNRLTGAAEPLGVTSEYGYDANGDLTSLTDPRGNATGFAYDELGRLTEIAQPLGKTTTYAYDLAGNRLSQTTAAGTLEYGYDAADRLTNVSAGESVLRSLGYDAVDRLISATDAEGHKIEIGRNEEGLVSSIDDGRGQVLTRSYDSRGELARQVDGRGTLEYGYDKLGRLTSLTDPQGKVLGFGYDPEGDLTEVTRPNGVTTTNVYDEAGRLAETTSVGGEPPMALESLKYGYDPAGDLTSRLDRRLEAETTYTYDALGRLTEFDPPGEGATAYSYDKAGNRTEAGGTTYSYDALNQLTEASDGTTYSYDGDGRMIGKVKGPEETTYEWDPLDHLAKVEGPSGAESYAYDGLERLSEHKGSGGTKVFHYGDLGDDPILDTGAEGETLESYVQGPAGLLEERSGGTTDYPLANAHGDITALTNEAGDVQSRQEYGPWGEQLSGPSLEMGYLGAQQRRSDSATGLIQMGQRVYDPLLGQFTSEDPVLGRIGISPSFNHYAYVWDDPLGLYDLDGRFPSLGDIAGAVGGAANDVWNTGKEIVTHPGEATTNAVEYWAGSDSPASYVFGPLSVLGDMAINPDRASYYLEKATPAQMAATGILVAGSAGLIAVTAEATADCLAVTAGIDAVHVCGQVAAIGGGIAATGGVLAVEVAKR